MKKQKEEVKEPSAPFWMVTYSDMVTLLLVFFILILSYSTIELEKFKGAMSSMKGALGIMTEMGSAAQKRDLNVREKLTHRQRNTEEDFAVIRDMIARMQLGEAIEAELTGSGIHLRLGDDLLFDVAKAVIKPGAYPILRTIADVVRNKDCQIFVEGHTDNIPINTAQFPTNWELSTARALSVVRFLHDREGVDASRLAAVGHGEHRPLVDNNSAENRAKNRRVEIYIRDN